LTTGGDRFERYVEALGLPAGIDFVEAGGRGGIRQSIAGSLGFWLPMTWSVHLIPAKEFVFLGRVRVAGIPLRSGGDELRDGHGRFRMGRRFLEGSSVDRAQHAALWAWSLLFAPRVALRRQGVIVEPAGDDGVRLALSYGAETWECALRFDPATGLLRRLDTHRDDATTGRSRRWSAEVERWETRDGHPSPARVLTRWETTPAVRLDVARVDVSVAGTR
jgi:hypothetical protein